MTRIIPFPILQALNTRFLGQSVRKLFLPFLAFFFAFTAIAQSDFPCSMDADNDGICDDVDPNLGAVNAPATVDYFNEQTQISNGLHDHLECWLSATSVHGFDGASDDVFELSNGTAVSTWVDISGSNNHAYSFGSGKPTIDGTYSYNSFTSLSGKSILKFNGVRMQNEQASFSISNKITCYYVIEQTSQLDPWNATVLNIGGSVDSNGDNASTFIHYNNGQPISGDGLLDEKMALFGDAGTADVGLPWSAYYVNSVNASMVNEADIYKFEFNVGTISLYKNATLISSKTGASLDDYNVLNSRFQLGDDALNDDLTAYGQNKKIDINFAELMVFNTVLSSDEDNKIYDYLSQKWFYVSGCTEICAVNYNPDAVNDDGTCQYGLLGQSSVDQENTEWNTGIPQPPFDYDPNNDGVIDAAEYYQSFTADQSGALTAFSFRHNGTYSSELNVTILSGEGLSGEVLYNYLWSYDTNVNSNEGWVIHVTPWWRPDVVAGQVYTIQLEATGPTGGGFLGTDYSSYSGGLFYYTGYAGEYGDLAFRTYVDPVVCGCDGNVLDAIDVCGGDCSADVNGNGICDIDEISGCTDLAASNYNSEAVLNDGSCEYDVYGCTISFACNYDPLATIYNGTCDFFSCLVFGCNDIDACNYDELVTNNDGSCDYLSCLVIGCTIDVACNYDPLADVDDGSCEFTSCAGCTDSDASNYDETATNDDGSCEFPGCLDISACNYDATANTDDGSCDYTSCVVPGCTIPVACNYDSLATTNDGSCVFAETFYDCDGVCLEDTDADGICDQLEIAGCDDETANNYNPLATDNNGSCIYPTPGCLEELACNYDFFADVDDGTCEYTSCAGCMSPGACNYDETATIDDGLCAFPEDGYDCDGVCLVDTDGDGVCDMFEILGCIDLLACNFNDEATDSSPAQCSYANANQDCEGNSLLPSFVNAPANVSLEACNVPSIEDVVIEAVVSAFAADYESVYNSNDCYENNPTLTIVASEFIIEGSCDNEYTLFRSWTATDCAGYSVAHEQVITVSDNIAPTLDVPADMNVACDAVADAVFGDATSYSNCGESTISVVDEIVSGACQGSYEIHRTFTVTDDCGNSSSGVQTITVVDEVAPELVLPADYTVECSDNIVRAPANASDNCGSFTISNIDLYIPGDNAGNYLIERTFTAIDDCGNSSSGVQTITVVDTTAPSLSIPSDYTSECSDELVLNDASGTDNCGGVSISVESETVPGNALGNYTVVRTFTATDDSGNSTSATQTITVVDTTSPEIIAPADFIAECSDDITYDDATATDNCGTVSISSTDETISGSSAGTYLIVRTFTATDDAGNVSSDTQTITVVDTTAPVITPPADYTVECSDVIIYDDATATDNCGEVSITVYDQTLAGSSIGNYTILRTFTAIDDAGNSSEDSQTITVVDTTSPVLEGVPSDITSECSSIPDAAEVTSSDNCGTSSVSLSENILEGACDGEFTLTRTWTATDDAGNTSVSSQVITVVDTTAPVFEPMIQSEASCSVDFSLPNPVLTGGCSEESITVSEETVPGDCPQSYSIVRLFTAVDACGNTSSLTHTTVISDEYAPVVVSGPDFGIDNAQPVSFLNGELIPEAGLSIEDNCDASPVWTYEDADASESDVLALNIDADQTVIARSYTVSDACGNEETFVHFIVIEWELLGCMDVNACNYDVDVNTDDGSCDFCSCNSDSASPYTLTVESAPAVTQADHTVYRFYVNMANESDKFSALYGNDQNNLVLNTPDGIFNSAFNASWSASGINPAFMAAAPELVDDSYATIGLDGPAVSPQADPGINSTGL